MCTTTTSVSCSLQGASEIYAKQHRNMSPTATATLLHALEFMHTHAHAIDMDTDLRQRLAVQQAEDRVPDERMVRQPHVSSRTSA